MPLKDETDRAIIEHYLWGERLRNAIESGVSSISVEEAATDKLCPLGKWLYSDHISHTERQLPKYGELIALHAKFHQHASEILSLALAGNKMEALARLSVTSDYATTSLMLTGILKTWSQTTAPATNPPF